MKPEDKARQNIDKMLLDAGWQLQDYENLNLGESLGIAVRYFQLKTGEADYLLFIDRKAAGAIEAKREGATLGGVDVQSDKYLIGLPDNIPAYQNPLPFAYESTGIETFFRDQRDPYPRSRRLFAFHKPETLQELLEQRDTLRAKLQNIPELITKGLRDCQIEAITQLEKSFYNNNPRALIQMASGGGKTYTAISFIYRLIKFANAKRILFLVDRRTLGKQTFKEFQQFTTPDDGRKFTSLYNVQLLTSNKIDTVSKVCITTIQRFYSMLKGDPEYDTDNEEHSTFEMPLFGAEPIEVSYNPEIPIETFDFIVTDECHRSIYNLWRQVLEYFDAFIIGLTATPSKQTIGFFNRNLVMEYPHERAVADGVNVAYEVYRIKTNITSHGGKVEAGYYIDRRDKLTRETLWEQLDEDLEYTSKELDRKVVVPDQIRTILKTFRDKLPIDIFPGRQEVPKTLIFAKDDSHAEDIVNIAREVFGKGNEFCRKITYRTTGEKPETLIASFRNSYYPRIAVTVDMISTGTDIRALECLIFMRNIRSAGYFEQMKGRGARVVTPTELQSVTPGAKVKDRFVIIDAIGVCESDKSDSKPLERKRHIAFDKLLNGVAMGDRTDDTISSLAGRLAMLNRKISDKEQDEISKNAEGKPLKELINKLLDALDPEKIIKKAKELFKTDRPDKEQVKNASKQIKDEACKQFDNPKLRNSIIEIKRKNEQIIDTTGIDTVIELGFDSQAKLKSQTYIDTFKKFIEDNKDELIALQIFYNKPYGQRKVTFEQIEQLADEMKKPPYDITYKHVWQAYRRLNKVTSKKPDAHKILTDIVSLVRFATEEIQTLEPFSDIEDKAFANWLDKQKIAGKQYTTEQIEWLTMIKDHITTNLTMEIDDFDLVPFYEKGGIVKAHRVFGEELPKLIEELNEALAA
ncbi:MAG: DEAD/DEAH box helicase family protein [candidate division Zixibacteria bacterium]|nr:DEAD/DEAH box helicase family protein [candidate division Zixibacteria bacterium]